MLLHDIPKERAGLPPEIERVLKGIFYGYPDMTFPLQVIPNRRATRTQLPFTVLFKSAYNEFDDEMYQDTYNRALNQVVPEDYEIPLDRLTIHYD